MNVSPLSRKVQKLDNFLVLVADKSFYRNIWKWLVMPVNCGFQPIKITKASHIYTSKLEKSLQSVMYVVYISNWHKFRVTDVLIDL